MQSTDTGVRRLRLTFQSGEEIRQQFGRYATFDSLLVPAPERAAEGSMVSVELVLPPPHDPVTLLGRVGAVVSTPSTPQAPWRWQLATVKLGEAERALLKSLLAAPREVPPAPARAFPVGVPRPAPLPRPEPEPVRAAVKESLRTLLEPLPAPRRRTLSSFVDEALDLQERARVRTADELSETVTDFLQRLTRGVVKTTYYDGDHAGARDAKVGLYESFRRLVGEDREVTLFDHSDGARRKLLVYGIFEDPRDVERILRPGQAELLVPKLTGFLDARNALSVTFKRALTEGQFYRFVDVLADHHLAQGDVAGFTAAMVSACGENVSVVFKETRAEKRQLSWRVSIALTRLTRDLSILPLFKGRTPEELHRVRMEVFKDVVRPLRNVRVLTELLINADLVAEHVHDVTRDELETLLQDAISPGCLPAVLASFAEQVAQAIAGETERAEPLRRLTGNLARKLARSSIPSEDSVYRKLFDLGILALDDLPAGPLARVHRERKAALFLSDWRGFLHAFDDCTEETEYKAHLDMLRVVWPELLDGQRLEIIRLMVSLVTQHARTDGFAGRRELAAGWLRGLATGPAAEDMAQQLTTRDKQRRAVLLSMCSMLGEPGLAFLFRALCECPTRLVRHEITETLESTPAETAGFLAVEITRPDIPWYYRRNLLDILGRVGGDRALASRYQKDPHPRVRQQAFLTACELDPAGAELGLITGLSDPEPEIRTICLRRLVQKRSLEPILLSHLRALLTGPQPEKAREACELLAAYQSGPGRALAVDLLRAVLARESRRRSMFGKVLDDPELAELQVVACHALGRLREPTAVARLTELAAGQNRAVAAAAAHAVRAIQGTAEGR